MVGGEGRCVAAITAREIEAALSSVSLAAATVVLLYGWVARKRAPFDGGRRQPSESTNE